MDINDDLVTFFEWAVLMGVPPNIVPSFQVLQTTLRARSMIVMDMVQKVRPQQEVQLMRDNILIHRMRKLKDKELPMSVRSFIPERYDRFDKIRNANQRIKDTTEKLDRIKLQSSKMLEKIKSLNIAKTKLQKRSADSVTKQKILEAKLMMMADEMDKVKVQEELVKHNSVVAPDAFNMDEDRAVLSLSKAKSELEAFYKQNDSGNCEDKNATKDAKAELFASVRRSMHCQPNLILYRTVQKSITNELDSLLHRDGSGNSSLNRSSVEETIAKNISDSYQRFILRSTQLDAERDALHTITDNYEHLYTDMNESLNRSMADTKRELRDDFIKETSHLHLNEGRIQFLHTEIARNKELLRERSDKMRAMVESQEAVKEVIRQSQSGLSSMVSDMKQMQKISRQLYHVRDLTDKHMLLMKGDFKVGNKLGGGAGKTKRFNTCIPDDVKGFTLVDELKLFGDIPMAYLNTLDQGQLFRRYSPIYMYKPDVIRASRYAHLFTVEGFLRQVKDICNVQMYLSTINRKREFTMPHIHVLPDEIRKREYEQNMSVYRLLKVVDQHFDMIQDLQHKCRTYYDFLMSTPLKGFIPPCTKIEGKNYQQFENEFLLYYRMVRGAEKMHDEME